MKWKTTQKYCLAVSLLVFMWMLWAYHSDNSPEKNIMALITPRHAMLAGNNCVEKNLSDVYELEATDPCLIEVTRSMLHGRLNPLNDYRFYANPPKLDGQAGQPGVVDKILGGQTGGFYIECGAADGEENSNTLFFEMKRNWKGLLIEPSRKEFATLIQKNRNAKHINVCLSDTSKPKTVAFDNRREMPQLAKISDSVSSAGTSKEVCLPLYSILLALGNPTVDYLSLDIEGAELGVLRSIPWDKINVKVVSVEENKPTSDPQAIRRLMESNGFCFYQSVYEKGLLLDNIYVQTSLCEKLKK